MLDVLRSTTTTPGELARFYSLEFRCSARMSELRRSTACRKQKFDQNWAVTWKRCEIKLRIVMFNNRKRHSIAAELSDLQWPWTAYWTPTCAITVVAQLHVRYSSIRCVRSIHQSTPSNLFINPLHPIYSSIHSIQSIRQSTPSNPFINPLHPIRSSIHSIQSIRQSTHSSHYYTNQRNYRRQNSSFRVVRHARHHNRQLNTQIVIRKRYLITNKSCSRSFHELISPSTDADVVVW